MKMNEPQSKYSMHGYILTLKMGNLISSGTEWSRMEVGFFVCGNQPWEGGRGVIGMGWEGWGDVERTAKVIRSQNTSALEIKYNSRNR